MQRSQFLGPRSLGPLGGAKGQISLNLNYKVNFKDFLTKLCVSSYKLKIYNISASCLGHAQGWVPSGGLGVKKFFSENQPDSVWELLT